MWWPISEQYSNTAIYIIGIMSSANQPQRVQPPQPPPPPQPPKRQSNERNDQPAAKRGKMERECSVCKRLKSLQDNFSKSQRNKGANAKCKECIDVQQRGRPQQEENRKLAAEKREAKRKLQEENRKLAAEKREAKRKQQELIRKKAEEERKKEEEERNRAAKIREAEEKKKVIAVNEEKEAQHYKQMKELYELHVLKLKDEGKDIEKEMTTPSNLVYVVTSISKRGDTKFSPHLQGIFTTCQRAKECSRKVFENTSKSYRDGKFEANEDRTAKCDTTEFLIPGVECNVRVMFELFGKIIKAPKYSGRKDDHVYECTAIGITVIPIDTDDDIIAGVELPFLRTLTWSQKEDEAKTRGAPVDQAPVVGGTEVYPVFVHMPGDNIGDSTDVNLCGVFRNKDSAMKLSLKERKKMLSVQKANFPRVYNGIPFYQMLHENCCAVDIENVMLDAHGSDSNGEKKLKFGSKKGGYCWLKPDIEWFCIS